MAQQKKSGRRQPIPRNLLKFVRDKLATATTTISLAKQATVWYADQKKVDGGQIFGGRDLAGFTHLVYRVRSGRTKSRKTKRVLRSAHSTRPKTKAIATAPKTTMTLRDAIEVYEAYLKIAPQLRLAEAYLKQQGLKYVIIGETVTVQKL